VLIDYTFLPLISYTTGMTHLKGTVMRLTYTSRNISQRSCLIILFITTHVSRQTAALKIVWRYTSMPPSVSSWQAIRWTLPLPLNICRKKLQNVKVVKKKSVSATSL